MVRGLRAPPGMVFWCGRGAFFGILGMPLWTLFSPNQKATLDTSRVHGSGPSGTSWHGVLVFYGRVFCILGMPAWTLFSTNQKATLGTGRVHGVSPSGTFWHGVLVFYGRIFWHLGDTILDLVFYESERVRAPPGMVFWCGMGEFFWHLGDTILDLVFFESESNVRHRPCP